MDGSVAAAIASVAVAVITGAGGAFGLVYKGRSERKAKAAESSAGERTQDYQRLLSEYTAMATEVSRLREGLTNSDTVVAELRAQIKQLLDDTDKYLEEARKYRAEAYALQVRNELLKKTVEDLQGRPIQDIPE